MQNVQCTVCFGDIIVTEREEGGNKILECTQEKITRLACDHFFHDDCLNPWLRNNHSCPNCRRELPPIAEDIQGVAQERFGPYATLVDRCQNGDIDGALRLMASNLTDYVPADFGDAIFFANLRNYDVLNLINDNLPIAYFNAVVVRLGVMSNFGIDLPIVRQLGACAQFNEMSVDGVGQMMQFFYLLAEEPLGDALLQHPHFNEVPIDSLLSALRRAAVHACISAVRKILALPQCNQMPKEDLIELLKALLEGYEETLQPQMRQIQEMILQSIGFPEQLSAEMLGEILPYITYAAPDGQCDLIQILFACEKFKDIPIQDLEIALKTAAKAGRLQVIKMFLSCTRADQISLTALKRSYFLAEYELNKMDQADFEEEAAQYDPNMLPQVQKYQNVQAAIFTFVVTRRSDEDLCKFIQREIWGMRLMIVKEETLRQYSSYYLTENELVKAFIIASGLIGPDRERYLVHTILQYLKEPQRLLSLCPIIKGIEDPSNPDLQTILFCLIAQALQRNHFDENALWVVNLSDSPILKKFLTEINSSDVSSVSSEESDDSSAVKNPISTPSRSSSPPADLSALRNEQMARALFTGDELDPAIENPIPTPPRDPSPSVDLSALRNKCIALALSTPIFQTVKTILNVVYRIFRLVTFMNLWVDSSRSLKERFIDMGADLLRIVLAPVALLGLEAAAIYGIFRPEEGIRAYSSLEQAIYTARG